MPSGFWVPKAGFGPAPASLSPWEDNFTTPQKTKAEQLSLPRPVIFASNSDQEFRLLGSTKPPGPMVEDTAMRWM